MFRSPTGAGLPPFSILLSDLPATPAQVARHLDLAPATIDRYQRTENAPRAVMLALFWETRWGRSAADTEAANWGAVYYRQAKGLERERNVLLARLVALEAELAQKPGEAANGRFWA